MKTAIKTELTTSTKVNSANISARKANKAAKAIAVENMHEIEIGDHVDTQAYEVIKGDAFTAYTTGRNSSYRALALAFIWYELAKNNTSYITAEFDQMRTKTLLNNYTNTIKRCFKLDITSQAPTISKYARVLGYIGKHYNCTIDEQSDTNTVAGNIAKLIADCGGLDACAKAYNDGVGNAAPQVSSTRMTAQDVSKAMKGYKNKKRKSLGSLQHNKHLEGRSGELVVMIGRVENTTIDVVDIITNSDVVEHVIRKK